MKTKRQLRAEAVERLKNSEYHTALDDICSMLGWGHEPHFEGATDALIDLLTDDEPDDDSAHESDVRTANMDANDVKVSTMPLKMPSEIRWHYTDGGEYTQELTGDSREKLEADVRQRSIRPSTQIDCTYNDVLRWLDRQAAITQHEITERWAEHLHPIERKCGDLRRKVEELTAERDELKAKHERIVQEMVDANTHQCERTNELTNELEVARAKNRLLRIYIAKMQDGRHGWHIKAEKLQDRVDELTDERDVLKGQIDTMRDVTREFRDERDNLQLKLDILKAHGVDIVSSADGGYEVYNVAIDERNKYREKLSRAIGLAREIGDLGK